MSDIRDEILNKRKEIKNNILKSFSESDNLIEKATYKDNSKNRKLNRVGQEYGGKGKDEDSTDKYSDSKDDSNKSSNKNSNTDKEDNKSSKDSEKENINQEMYDNDDSLSRHASNTTTEDLQSFIKTHSNNPKMKSEVEIANKELEKRNSKESKENPETETNPENLDTDDLINFIKENKSDSKKMDLIESYKDELKDRDEWSDSFLEDEDDLIDNNRGQQENKTPKYDYDSISGWIGDDYSESHISSVIESLEDVGIDDRDLRIKKTNNWSIEKFNTAIQDKVKELKSEIRIGNLSPDLKDSDVENIIWGLVMHNHTTDNSIFNK